jgi:hypothetical protein
MNVIGEEVRSAIDSLLTAKIYPITVNTSAHCPKAELDVGDKSRTIPDKNPITSEPLWSSEAMSEIATATYKENPVMGKCIFEIADSCTAKIKKRNRTVEKILVGLIELFLSP